MPSPNSRRKLGYTFAAILVTLSGSAIHPLFLCQSLFGEYSTFEPNIGASNSSHATPKDYGAKGNAITVTDGAISSGSAHFTSAVAAFGAADAGKAIAVSGAGSGGDALVALISAVTSPTNVTLSVTASTTVSRARADYGTDDTAAVRSCIQHSTLLGGRCTINDGARFMMSNASTTISVAGTNDGKGTLIFAPQGPLTSGSNDRLFYIASSEAAGPFPVRAGPIARGATSFTAQNSIDAAQLSRGDWVIMTEKDSGATDVIYSDWLQIGSVVGTTVNIVGPLRMSFP